MLQILLLLGVTATSSVIHAEQDVPLPLVCDIESCSRDSFCGIDGVCRPKSCENYYEFGNRTFTGYNEIDPVPLDCSSIPETILNDGVTSLTFRCSSMMTQPFISHGYNRKCTAITPTVSSFECYSIDPSTDFSRFLRRTETESIDCSPSNETPFFAYVAISEWDRHGESYVGFSQAHNLTYELDPDAAVQGTIFTHFALYPTESPTTSPTTSPTIDTPISGSVGTGVSISTLLALAGLAVVTSCASS